MRKLTNLFTGNVMSSVLAATIIPLLLMAAVSFFRANMALEDQSEQSTGALREAVEQTLVAQNKAQRDSIEDYLQQIENQVLTFSEMPMIAEALGHFRDSSKHYARQMDLTEAELEYMRGELRRFYMNDFDRIFREKNGRGSDASQYFSQLSDRAVLFQYEYILANPNPIGEKHQLDRADRAEADYNRHHAKYHPSIRSYLEKFGYYDIFLIDHETGRIVYSVFKELDYMTSLKNGPYAQTNFADAFRAAANASSEDVFAFEDLALYGPSYDAPAGFIASPVFDGSKKVGVVVFQMPLDRISEVMAETGGLGKKGDAYLVGADGLMRSNSYRNPDVYSVSSSFANQEAGRANHEFAKKALAGASGREEGVGLGGREVFAAFSSIEIGNARWAVISEVDPTEAFAVVSNLADLKSKANMSLIIWSLGILAIGIGVVVVFVHRLVAPIHEVLRAIEHAAAGDLTKPPSVNRRDEIGQMANRFAEFIGTLRGHILSIKNQGEELTTSSSDLKHVAGRISGEISEINNQSNSVASTTEEMTANISTVAAAIEESSTNVQNVAAAVEEMSQNLSTVSDNVEGMAGNVNTVATAVESMSGSLGDVADSSTQAADIATRAAEAAKQTNDTVSHLGDSAQEIGKVVGVINDIAEQTNLLALNATIEAASAGEAGRGFAVVANEVKELAKQTATATDEIREKISDMQETTRGSVAAIQEIVGIIDEINSISQEIATSVASQRTSATGIAEEVANAAKAAMIVNENVRECSVSASEIAKNGDELSSGANEISRSAAEASSGATQTATSIQQVSESVRTCAEGASNADESAQHMANLAARLHELVDEFTV